MALAYFKEWITEWDGIAALNPLSEVGERICPGFFLNWGMFLEAAFGFYVISFLMRGRKSAQLVTRGGKPKATEEDQLQKWRIQWGIFIYHRRQPLNIYRGLCFVPRAANIQKRVFFKFKPEPGCWRTQHLDLAYSRLMQHPHLASHCLPSYKPTELPVLYCVACYFSPLSLFLAILSTSLALPQKRVAERTADCSKVVAIVSYPPVQETALHSPQIFLLQTMACFSKCVTS